MDLGEYGTNVLSINNFATVQYEYFECRHPYSGGTRAQLRKVETSWRQEGSLVHCDPIRDGIWRFRNGTEPQGTTQISKDIEVHGVTLRLNDHGTYEPANLGRPKNPAGNNFNTPSNNSSPSSSLENSVRNAQAANARAVQANATHNLTHEPPTPSPGTKSTFSPDDYPRSLRGIHEQLISAVLGSITYFLCRDHGYLPLNARTLVVKPQSSGGDQRDNISSEGLKPATLATIDVNLTSLGTLIVKAHTDPAPRFRCLVNTSSQPKIPGDIGEGTAIWLAPGGHPARFYGKLDGNQMPVGLRFSRLPMSPADQSQHGLSGGGVRSWKSNCLDLLAGQGLNPSTLDAGGWVLIQIFRGNSVYPGSDRHGLSLLDDLNVVPWPALLCFQTCAPESHSFEFGNFPVNYDPLSFAEEWFTTKEDRSKIVLRRQKERQVAEASTREQADAESRTLLSNNFSPHALRRSSNAGAIYPTPPDAVHHPIGATPSFDGAGSTPGNPHQLFPQEIDTVAPANMGVSAEPGAWGSSEIRQDPTKASVHFNDNENDNENLFGDIGGDLFGETDITDADFNFFDEPDAGPVAQNSGAPTSNADPKSKDSILDEILALDDINGNGNGNGVGAVDLEVPGSEPVTVEEPDVKAVTPPTNIALEKKEIKKKEEGKVISFKTPLLPHAQVNTPFTKEAVFKLLFKGALQDKQSKFETLKSDPPRKASSFNKVDVEASLLAFNEKYGKNGRFNFSEDKQLHRGGSPELPKTEYLQRRRKSKVNGNKKTPFSQILNEDNMEVDVEEIDSEGTSPSSERDETNSTMDDFTLTLNPGVKRKRDLEKNEGDDMTTTFKTLAVEGDLSVSTPQSITGSPLPILDIDAADWSLAPYVTSQSPDIQPSILTDVEYMAAAQILADQAVSSTLGLPGLLELDSTIRTSESCITRDVMRNLVNAAKPCLKDAVTCSMRSFLDIQGIPVLSQGVRLPPRPMPHPRGPNFVDPSRANNLFPLHIPRLEVRRADSNLTLLPAGVSFWDNLGLGPSQGPKDVSSICVYPKFEGLADSASSFLSEMTSTYESYRFGSHDRIVSNDLVDGVLPLPVDSQQTSQIYTLSVIKETMTQLSKILLSSATSADEKNFVIYFIYPSNNPGLLVHICSAFDHLFNLYRKGLSEKKAVISTELVLQLIPLDFVASPTSLVVPRPSEYGRLAMEVYDRCIEFTSCSSMPAILLERPIPKGIDFKLTTNPSPSLLLENSCLHIAYAQSIDDRWITAAWTDNRGSKQMTASYCLGRKNESISMPFSDVAHEIWETTLGLISHKKVHWRLMIVKVGVMDPAEIEFWTGLASTESDAQVNLTLIATNPDPSLQLIPEPIKLPPAASTAQTVLTPVSTPQAASILSPENASTPMRDPAANPATPSDTPIEPDNDARLIDLTDQSWGAVLSHRLNNSRSLLEFNPALISGYLIKRGGTSSSDTPIILEVNIIHTDFKGGNPRTVHEGLLREILSYYRGLATLARVRGVVNGVKDGRPWHIAAAEKAVAALHLLM